MAEEIGIDRFLLKFCPRMKTIGLLNFKKWIKDLIGEGVNYAPAPIRTSVGVAIGNGTDVDVCRL